MNEFALIEVFFKSIVHTRDDVVLGIGDDAACLSIPLGKHLLVSSDTLVSGIHFLADFDAFDIAYKAIMVNISDIAAMGGEPAWVSLALTLPECNEVWLKRFSEGLTAALLPYNIALIGGDTTRGPLTITVTIHGLVAAGKAVARSGAKAGDAIFVSGELGAAALAVDYLSSGHVEDKELLMEKLLHPIPRVDLIPYLQQYATAAIDISDGLNADLNHICDASGVGACLDLEQIPVHPVLKKHRPHKALAMALQGGDDYELCFTIPREHEQEFKKQLKQHGKRCVKIGMIEEAHGLRGRRGACIERLPVKGYSHF